MIGISIYMDIKLNICMLYTRYNVYMLSRPHVSALTFQQNVGKHLNLNGNSSAPSTLNTYILIRYSIELRDVKHKAHRPESAPDSSSLKKYSMA